MEEATQVTSSEVPVVKGDVDDLKTADISVKVMIISVRFRRIICFLLTIRNPFCKLMRILQRFYLFYRIESPVCLSSFLVAAPKM